jgi:hypothetical protein
MTAGLMREYVVDQNYNSYRSFFDHEWAKVISAEATGPELSQLVFDLTAGWKGAANTSMLPWLIIHTLKNFATGYSNHTPTETEKWIDAMFAWLEREIGCSLSLEQQERMRTAADKTRKDILEQKRLNPLQFNEQEVWDSMLQLSEFRISVISCLRITYAAVYYCYEDFVTSCYRLLRPTKGFRISRTFCDKLSSVYSPATANDVWQHDEVRLPRLVRHAIVHNGARETDELKRMQNPIGVVDGMLQITPSVLRIAFNSLKGRALLLLRETSKRHK